MPNVPEAGPEKRIVEEGSILGVTPKNWGYLLTCLLTLYVCLALYYYALMTIAYEVRGAEYMKLPTRFFGSFDRDNYYEGFGSVLDQTMEIYPWILEKDCAIDGETTVYPMNEKGEIYTDVCFSGDHVMYNKDPKEKEPCVFKGLDGKTDRFCALP